MSLNIDPTVTVIKALFLYFNLLNNIANIQEKKLMLIHNQNAGIHYKYKISIKPIYIIIERQKTNFTYIYNGGVK